MDPQPTMESDLPSDVPSLEPSDAPSSAGFISDTGLLTSAHEATNIPTVITELLPDSLSDEPTPSVVDIPEEAQDLKEPEKPVRVDPRFCQPESCTEFDSLANLQKWMLVDRYPQLCACSFQFRDRSKTCTGTEMDTTHIRKGREVALTCAAGHTCELGCANTIFEIENGGTLHLRNLVITGGDDFSRVFVSHGGRMTGKFLNVTNTAALFNNKGRNLQRFRSQSNYAGKGAGVLSFGTLRIEDSNFTSCQASTEGGAIYTEGKTTLIRTQFTENLAARGGAIAALDGTVDLLHCNFADNTGMVGSPDILSTRNAEIRGCEIGGLGFELECDPFRVPSTASSHFPCVSMLLVVMNIWRLARN